MTAVEGWMESEGAMSGCQGGGVHLPRRADLFLDIVFSSHEAFSAPEGLLLQWFGDDDD